MDAHRNKMTARGGKRIQWILAYRWPRPPKEIQLEPMGTLKRAKGSHSTSNQLDLNEELGNQLFYTHLGNQLASSPKFEIVLGFKQTCTIMSFWGNNLEN